MSRHHPITSLAVVAASLLALSGCAGGATTLAAPLAPGLKVPAWARAEPTSGLKVPAWARIALPGLKVPAWAWTEPARLKVPAWARTEPARLKVPAWARTEPARLKVPAWARTEPPSRDPSISTVAWIDGSQ